MTEVLIVGAGPTGLTLACELARRGRAYRIIDAAAEHFAGSRGKGMQPRTLEVLEDLGVLDEILAAGSPLLTIRAYAGRTVLADRDLHERLDPTPDRPYVTPMLIPQFSTEAVLRHRLAELGGKIELDTALTGFTSDDAGVTATLSTGEEIRADYLVGCDGGRSLVRKTLGVGFLGETHDSERMLIGDFRVTGLDREYWSVWPTGGFLALCPLPGTDRYQFQASLDPAAEPELTLDYYQDLVTRRTGREDLRLVDATWMSVYRTNIRMVDRFRVGRVLLAGDAAHVHSPAGGQGLNTGIQDAYNLGWKLAAVLAGAPAALLDSYEEERLPVAAWLLGVTTHLHRTSTLTDEAPRDSETLQLDLTYRGSSVGFPDGTDPDGGDPAVRAGDRAPDAPLADGTRLFEAFRGPHWTLLSFGGPAPALPGVPAREIDAALDADGHAHRAYGVDPGAEALVLVRPDGHLGLVHRGPGGAAELAGYLARF